MHGFHRDCKTLIFILQMQTQKLINQNKFTTIARLITLAALQWEAGSFVKRKPPSPTHGMSGKRQSCTQVPLLCNRVLGTGLLSVSSASSYCQCLFDSLYFIKKTLNRKSGVSIRPTSCLLPFWQSQPALHVSQMSFS